MIRISWLSFGSKNKLFDHLLRYTEIYLVSFAHKYIWVLDHDELYGGAGVDGVALRNTADSFHYNPALKAVFWNWSLTVCQDQKEKGRNDLK